ncbi:MAG: UDP-N-acetylglucosamine pyrophosphorylase [Syntrophus sp. (in: bacteria)]|nr:UDP-N-acetylglucosamine pyrophosphorylase [Syntrophus sp. (in: bacteria)]
MAFTKEITERTFIHILQKYNQSHLLTHFKALSPAQKTLFIEGLQGLDFDLIFSLYKGSVQIKEATDSFDTIGPATIIPIPESAEEKAFEEKARLTGESLIRQNKVAVLIVAGGQGSRLGYNGPKGMFPISPVRNKTLFQLFSESVKAMSIRYNAHIPLLIMTSRENDQETRAYFDSCHHFGLPEDSVYFFSQGALPTITPDGGLLLKDDTTLFTNPDGHGGSLKAIHNSGLLKDLSDKGVTTLFYCQVDNPLVKIADPVFLGYHTLTGSEISTKVVRRKTIEEKVGVYISIAGKEGIVEYSDFGGRHMSALDPKGEILYWAGNTAIHVLNISFIKHLNYHGFALPYHRALRPVEAMISNVGPTKMDGWKFETFVFDAIPLAKKTCSMEVRREEEFSPVKNSEGDDSPASARAAMNNLFNYWLRESGLKTAPDTLLEISPLFALDKEELTKRLKGRAPNLLEDTYFGE